MENVHLTQLKIDIHEQIEKDKKIAKNLIQLLQKVTLISSLGEGCIFKKMQLVEGLEAAQKLLCLFGGKEEEIQGEESRKETDDQWIEFLKGKTPENYQYNLSDDLEGCGYTQNYLWVFCDTGENIYTLEKGRGLKTLLFYLWLAISENTHISQYGEKIRPLLHSSLFAGVYLPAFKSVDAALAAVKTLNEEERDELRNIYLGKQEFTWLSFDKRGRVSLWEAHNGYTYGGGHSIEGRLHQVLNRFPYNVPKDSSALVSQLVFPFDDHNYSTFSSTAYANFAKKAEGFEERIGERLKAVSPDQATAGSVITCAGIGTYFTLLSLNNEEMAVFGNASDLQQEGNSDFGYAIHCINVNATQIDGKDVYYLKPGNMK